MGLPYPRTPPSGALKLGDRTVILGEPVGRGSQATVHRATLQSNEGVRRTVACKVFGVLASEERDPLVQKLAEVVGRAACIQHPNVADVYELGADRAGGQPFILSELVAGASLRRLLDSFAQRSLRRL